MEASTAKKGGRSAYTLNSVGAQFRKQLHGLMGALNQCQPHYIRSFPPLSSPLPPGPMFSTDILCLCGSMRKDEMKLSCPGI